MNRHADTQVRHRPYDRAELEVYACSAQSLPLHVVHTLQVVFVVVVGFRVIVLAAQVDVLHADGQTHVKDIVEMYRDKYNHEMLMNDIRELNLIQHNHSLIAIRDTFEKENRFLVYYDERWDCKLFLNYKTVDQNNEDVIIDRISADLDVDKRKVSCNYVTSRVQEKYSVSHQENRIYNHRLYEVTLSKYSEKMKKDSFVVNGKRYYWMSVTEMEKDENEVRDEQSNLIERMEELS